MKIARNEPIDILRHNSSTHIASRKSARIKDVLVVGLPPMPSLGALTRAAYGRECRIRQVPNILRACDLLTEGMPDLLVLDVTQVPDDAAKSMYVRLRRFGYCGPVVAIGNGMNRLRRRELTCMGAVGALDYDDLNVAAMVEVGLAGAVPDRNLEIHARGCSQKPRVDRAS